MTDSTPEHSWAKSLANRISQYKNKDDVYCEDCDGIDECDEDCICDNCNQSRVEAWADARSDTYD